MLALPRSIILVSRVTKPSALTGKTNLLRDSFKISHSHFSSVINQDREEREKKRVASLSKYEKEMESLFREYDIVPFERGIV